MEEIRKHLAEIRLVLDQEADPFAPDMIQQKLKCLGNIQGLSAELISKTERVYNEKLGELVLAKEYKSLGATEKKILFGSLAAQEIELMTYASGLNKELHYQIEKLRSLLSYLKEEYRNANLN